MKKLTIIVILVALVTLLMPPVLGMQAHSRLQESLAQVSAQSNDYLSVTLEDYDQGWFNSTGKIRFSVSDAYIEANPLLQQTADDGSSLAAGLKQGFAQEVDITHGPIITSESVGLGLGEVVTTLDGSGNPELAELLTKTGNDYFVRSTMRIGLTGMGDLNVDAPPFTLAAPSDDVQEVIFAGGRASGSVDLSDMHLVMQGQMNGFSITSDDGEAVLERTAFDVDMAYPDSDPYGLGSGEFNMDRLVALTEDQTTVDISQAKISFASNKNGNDKVDIKLTYAIGQIAADGVDLENLEVSFALQELDVDTLIKMQELGNNMSIKPEDPDALMAQFTEPTYDMLAGGVVAKFEPIRFSYNNQPFDADMTIRAKPENLPPKNAFALDNPLIFMNLFAIDANLTVDSTMAIELAIPQVKQQLLAGVPEGTEVDEAQLDEMARAQAPMMMGALVGQGILRQEGTNYVMNAQYDNGALLVNGNPMPLGQMLGGG